MGEWKVHVGAITFDANGGSTSMPDQKIACGSSAQLATSVLTRAGYTFNGLNTVDSGTGMAYADRSRSLHVATAAL